MSTPTKPSTPSGPVVNQGLKSQFIIKLLQANLDQVLNTLTIVREENAALQKQLSKKAPAKN